MHSGNVIPAPSLSPALLHGKGLSQLVMVSLREIYANVNVWVSSVFVIVLMFRVLSAGSVISIMFYKYIFTYRSKLKNIYIQK